MIKLAKPYFPEQVYKKIIRILKSGNLVQGVYVKEFEEKLKQYLDIKHSIIVSSGTAALHLALLSLNLNKEDEIIVPAFTFPATANVVDIIGAKLVFVDINLTDFCINTQKIEKKITSTFRLYFFAIFIIIFNFAD